MILKRAFNACTEFYRVSFEWNTVLNHNQLVNWITSSESDYWSLESLRDESLGASTEFVLPSFDRMDFGLKTRFGTE